MLCPVLNWNLKILVSFVVQTSKMSRPFVLIQVELLSERVFKTCSSSVRIGCTTWQTWQTQGPVVGVGFLPQVCSINSLQVFLYLPVRSKLTHTHSPLYLISTETLKNLLHTHTLSLFLKYQCTLPLGMQVRRTKETSARKNKHSHKGRATEREKERESK